MLATFVFIYFGWKLNRALTVRSDTKILKTDHFVISYQGVYDFEANAISRNLEANYQVVKSDLHDNSNDIIQVFVYGNKQEFNAATGLNNNAIGTSRGPREFHILWTNWFNSIFPDDPLKTALHEFTHCIQLNLLINQALNSGPTDNRAFNEQFEREFSESYPRWLWEAVSIYEAKEVNRLSVKYAFRTKPGIQSLNNGNEIYLLGYTLVEYVVIKWGKEKLPALILSYGNTQKVLHVSAEEFENGWHQFVETSY